MKLSKITALLAGVGITFSAVGSDSDNCYYTVSVNIKGEPAGELQACPVYGGKDIAFTTRWDDSNKAHFRMQKIMNKHGIRGTFYVTNWNIGFDKLCEKGTDVGAHSMTHPRLGELTSNQLFWNAGEIRPVIEAATNKPINSYCFSYGHFENWKNRRISGVIAESLQRLGYHNNVHSNFVRKYTKGKDPVSTYQQIAAGDRKPSMELFDKKFNKLMKDQSWKRSHPAIGVGIHTWMGSNKAWNDMEAIYKKCAGREAWWYATQNEYGAYRKLYALKKIEKQSPEKYSVTLPYGSDIGSDIPLTMNIKGDVSAVLVNGKAVTLTQKDGATYFDLVVPEVAKAPQLISYTQNPENRDDAELTTKTAVKPLLLINDNTLSLKLKTGKEKISNVKVKYLLPFMYDHASADTLNNLNSNSENVITKTLVEREKIEDKYGRPFIICQVDYLADGKPERAFASSYGKGTLPPLTTKFRDITSVSSPFNFGKMKLKLAEMSNPDKPFISELKWYKTSDYERFNNRDTIISPKFRLSENEQKVAAQAGNVLAIELTINTETECSLMVKGKLEKVFTNFKTAFLNGKEVKLEALHKTKLNSGKNRIVFVIPYNQKTKKSVQFKYSLDKQIFDKKTTSSSESLIDIAKRWKVGPKGSAEAVVEKGVLFIKNLKGVAKVTASQTFRGREGQNISVRGNIRTVDSESKKVTVAVQAFTKQWKQVKFIHVYNSSNLSDSWGKFTRDITVPANAYHLLFAVFVEGKGDVCLKDISAQVKSAEY